MGETKLKEPAIPISYESTEVIETGKWSALKPRSQEKIPPCQESCPAGADIPLFLYYAGAGRYADALSALLQENPFPGVCGRVCFHPCESDCNRAQFDEPVSIQMLERFVAGAAGEYIQIQPAANPDPRKIAVIGSGPAGLACAYFLALLGHFPTVFEARKEPGGVMRYGIPKFRLPKPVLKREIQRILSLPVELKTGCRAGKDITFEELDRFDAVFLSPGAELNALLSIRGETLKGVWSGGNFLERVNTGGKARLGKTTIVIGGGNTAMDVARSAVRLGSKVTIAYRRTREDMPAIRDEVHEAEEESVEFQFLVQPVRIQRLRNGKLKVVFQRMKIGRSDGRGRRGVVPLKGEFLEISADSVITAVGETVDLSWIPGDLVEDGLIKTGSNPKIFAGGDAVEQPRTIVAAVAAAKRAAVSMDLSFRGMPHQEALSQIRIGRKGSLSLAAYLQFRETGIWPEIREVVAPNQINALYFAESRRINPRKLPMAKRLDTFGEVNREPDLDRALASASRCYSCGRCNACYNCYYFCPEGAVRIDRDRRTREVDLAHCKGCGTCASACPRNAVRMKGLP
jgi:NADPH-dependent glutamate synthase beta subunit-like oxidoreductase/Pyruvate/2-oxoacid:ferredoxin oxidoreductase delta subunit